MVAGLTLLLAGCGTQQASQTKDSSSSNSSSLLVAKSNEKVSTDKPFTTTSGEPDCDLCREQVW